MISPLLSYKSEIWAVYVKHDFKAWDKTPTEKNPLENLQALPSLEISNKLQMLQVEVNRQLSTYHTIKYDSES